MKRTMLSAVAVLSLAAGCARAAVVDSSASGFTVKIAVHIQAPPADVYRKFMRNIGDWWNPAHTYSGSAKNLTIDEKVPGCFCEKLPDGGGIRHLEILYLAPGKSVILGGPLGPMQSLAVTGSMRVQFTAEEGGTKFEVTYSAGGYLPSGLNTFAPLTDGMLTEQFARLKNYIEKGEPVAK